jgi:cell division septation protein DedD
MLVGKLKAKGYPATLFEQPSDEWHRVLVGPFSSESAAKGSQKKLKADGLDSILRKP